MNRTGRRWLSSRTLLLIVARQVVAAARRAKVGQALGLKRFSRKVCQHLKEEATRRAARHVQHARHQRAHPRLGMEMHPKALQPGSGYQGVTPGILCTNQCVPSCCRIQGARHQNNLQQVHVHLTSDCMPCTAQAKAHALFMTFSAHRMADKLAHTAALHCNLMPCKKLRDARAVWRRG